MRKLKGKKEGKGVERKVRQEKKEREKGEDGNGKWEVGKGTGKGKVGNGQKKIGRG